MLAITQGINLKRSLAMDITAFSSSFLVGSNGMARGDRKRRAEDEAHVEMAKVKQCVSQHMLAQAQLLSHNAGFSRRWCSPSPDWPLFYCSSHAFY